MYEKINQSDEFLYHYENRMLKYVLSLYYICH